MNTFLLLTLSLVLANAHLPVLELPETMLSKRSIIPRDPCQDRVEKCSGISCGYGGSCHKYDYENVHATCNCPPNYVGNLCQINLKRSVCRSGDQFFAGGRDKNPCIFKEFIYCLPAAGWGYPRSFEQSDNMYYVYLKGRVGSRASLSTGVIKFGDKPYYRLSFRFRMTSRPVGHSQNTITVYQDFSVYPAYLKLFQKQYHSSIDGVNQYICLDLYKLRYYNWYQVIIQTDCKGKVNCERIFRPHSARLKAEVLIWDIVLQEGEC